jgi:hypothetical protein
MISPSQAVGCSATAVGLLATIICVATGCKDRKPQTPLIPDVQNVWTEALRNAFVTLEDVSFEQFASKVHEAGVPVPSSATNIWVSAARFIDGHKVFVKYVASEEDVREACGHLCGRQNRVRKVPDIWPTREDVEIPPWFKMEATNGRLKTWLVVSATPHLSAGPDGKETPCGYSRVSGDLVSTERRTNVVYAFSFSIQWYRVGCGG